MTILITGICGFAGSNLAQGLQEAKEGLTIFGVDNFIRPGSELNRRLLQARGIRVKHADLRNSEDLESLPATDWIIDAAANPSVLAGTGGSAATSRNLMQHNLNGTINLLEMCRSRGSGLILLSTSRVYSISALAGLTVEVKKEAFSPLEKQAWPWGASLAGIAEDFSTSPPVSLYGASKACSELLVREYGAAFGFHVWINRLGVLAGAGQFGRADQGIFSYWIHSCLAKRPLKFIGFGGAGHQVRDCLHPRDLVPVLLKQMQTVSSENGMVTNFSGGLENSMSLRQLHDWCEARFGKHAVESVPENRQYDIPWLVLDSRKAEERFGWRVQTSIDKTLTEIAEHAEKNPNWLDWTA